LKTLSPVIVSRGGSIIGKWCPVRHQLSFLCTHFPEICEIMPTYVNFFLGDGLRLVSIDDTINEVQFADVKDVKNFVKDGFK
jgi:phosphomethylpyrimidine synthase